ncbi:unnamed protein product [Caenorhabditis bovis]|uniref:Globin domain-containing protein n=1 Tax=Caenorhabditis bovis TaxID=2654633 RepID=A0A8S1EZF7_9PELO|nr:unnamed protein product [Caenorhabditis bovis]
MGNAHANPSPTTPLKSRRKLWRQRRLSDPSQNQNDKNCIFGRCTAYHAQNSTTISKMLFFFSNFHLLPSPSLATNSNCTTPPTIQINGEASFDEPTSSEHEIRAKSASTDFTSSSASERRKMFLTSSTTNNSVARSLDDSMIAKMTTLARAKSHSPLKQMRTYSFRSISSEDNLIDKESAELVADSWRLVEARTSENTKCFGCFVLNRVFAKIPVLRIMFGVREDESVLDLPETHQARRHAKLLTNILHLVVKNVDELEAQVAPTVFKYGERHYRPDISPHMTEENIRVFCAQIVCTVFDHLNDAEATQKCAESWIELMRYLGQKLLDGHEFAKLSAEKIISINRNDHHLFLML